MNNSSGAERLRCALSRLAGDFGVGRRDSTADIVLILAQRAVAKASGGRASSRDAVLDLVGAFHEKLVRTASKKGGAHALVAQWCAMSDGELLAYVGKMLFHLALEANPNWKTVRALRILVSAAVARGAPAPGEKVFRPDTLIQDGRFRRSLVSEACRSVWLDAPASEGLRWSTEALTPVLMRNWELEQAEVAPSDDGAADEPEGAPFESLETTRGLIRALKAELAPADRSLLVSRDTGFKAASQVLGIGTATAHQRFQALVLRVKPIVAALGAGPEELERAVAALREDLA